MGYFTDEGLRVGRITGLNTPGVIAVLETPEDRFPIGMALRVGWDASDRSLWSLSVHGQDVPGRWIVENREFLRVE
jgi:hypothetical protein